MGAKSENSWIDIPGYKFCYRINDEGRVQKKLDNGCWLDLNPYIGGRARAMVKMRTADNRKVEVPVVWLMADAFMGGRKKGFGIVHKNGAKLDCSRNNLKFATMSECGKLSARNRRKAVMKINRSGEVVDIYPSIRAAAEKNFISQNAIWERCKRQIKDPYRLDGFDYQMKVEKEKK